MMLDNQPRGTICIEDLEIGMTRYLQKEITDRDIELFAEVSTDRNPVHLDDAYAEGTMSVAKAIAETDCISIIGGGDSVSAINKSGLADQISHISTGGGASLEFLEGKVLPGVDALSDRS